MNSRITVCLLNWKRPGNVHRIVDALRAQKEQPRIFLWNNSAAEADFTPQNGIDWVIDSYANKRCWPRWYMASFAETPYVMSLDDDLVPKDKFFIGDLCDTLEIACGIGDRIVGIDGVVLRPGMLYQGSNSLGMPEGEVRADIVKGRLLAFPTAQLRTVLKVGHMRCSEDDIALSGLLSFGQSRRHWVLPSFRDRTEELPDPHALWRQEGHFDRRDTAVKGFFPWHK